MKRDYFKTVIDNLSGVVNEARLSMSTLGWGAPNEQTVPGGVIAFKPGNLIDGYGNVPDLKFLNEMQWRIDYMLSKDVRPQLTLLWGGLQELFTDHHKIQDRPLKRYLKAVCERLVDHPGVNIELVNEIGHGGHLWFLGDEGQREFVDKYGGYVKDLCPDHLLTNSDGHGPEGTEERWFFDAKPIDYWNVHFPRDNTSVEDIPRWVRGPWHLNEAVREFAKVHPGKGYGRNDEPIFLQTREDHVEWPYLGSTRNWKLYGTMLWVCTAAGVGVTIHNQSGFFLGYKLTRPRDPNFVLTEPIYDVARFWQAQMKDFPIKGHTSHNASWPQSPVSEYSGSFKVFSLVGGQKRSIILVVLNPRGTVTLQLDHDYLYRIYEIDGNLVTSGSQSSGLHRMVLPPMKYKRCAIVRLDKV